MKVEFDYSELTALANRALIEKAAILSEVRDELRGVSFSLEREIKDTMPVRFGRARASWGHWTPSDLLPGVKDASPDDAVYEVRDNGLEIEQGSNVPYISALNEGHSKKAPSGFIDRAVKHAQQVLDQRIIRIFRRHL